MLVIDSLSTAKNKGGRGRTESGKPFLARSQRRAAARVAAVSMATAAVFAPPTADASPLFANAHFQGKATVTRFVPPVAAPVLPPPPKYFEPTHGILTSLFAERWGTFHYGIDLAAPIGTPIVAVTDGEIIQAGPAEGFGQWVRMRQDDGTIAVFGHVSAFYVTEGQKVKAGEVIAAVGNEGQSTGPHLHYEVWLPDGTKIDPLPWLIAHGIDCGPFAG
ncbi:MAG: M23 family metallopeptidase [Nocardiaceae bacterium]|nr:M23 family metallopeptidase [Nocardiaceae bacterium]